MRLKKISKLSEKVIGAALEVHKTLGPGILESSYQQCLAHELSINNITFKLEFPLSITYKGINLDCCYRIDLLIEDSIIFELKSVEILKPKHHEQLLSYMKLAKVKQGYLINYNVELLKHGLKSFVL